MNKLLMTKGDELLVHHIINVQLQAGNLDLVDVA